MQTLSVIRSITIVMLLFNSALQTANVMAGVMDTIFKKEIVLSPELNGTLLKKGVPVTNQKIERYVALDKSIVDATTTDEYGRFSFPEVKYSIPRVINPIAEIRISVALWTDIDDKTIDLLNHTRARLNNYDRFLRLSNSEEFDIELPFSHFKYSNGNINFYISGRFDSKDHISSEVFD